MFILVMYKRNIFVLILSLSQATYDISRSQVQSIQAGSRRAVQSFKYHCRNSVATVIFRANNGKEIAPSEIIYDGCQVNRIHCCI